MAPFPSKFICQPHIKNTKLGFWRRLCMFFIRRYINTCMKVHIQCIVLRRLTGKKGRCGYKNCDNQRRYTFMYLLTNPKRRRRRRPMSHNSIGVRDDQREINFVSHEWKLISLMIKESDEISTSVSISFSICHTNEW